MPGGGIFPLADCYNGIDYLYGACGYNIFYETRYFGIPSTLRPLPRRNEDQAWRLQNNNNIEITENGADCFVHMLV